MLRRFGLPVAVAALVLGAGWMLFLTLDTFEETLSDRIVVGNGRLEAEQVDIAAKVAGRVEAIAVAEGDMVQAGAVLVEMDTAETRAALARAQAEAALARESRLEAEAVVAQRESELKLANDEAARGRQLLDRGHLSVSALEVRETARQVAVAVLSAARAHVATVDRQIAAADAEVRRIETLVADSRLVAPAPGRVLYRLAEPGEVVQAGEPVATLLNLENVYMEVFLPAAQAGLLAIGADARIVLDVLPDYAIPAKVSFVSPEAQFTPKQVETMEEREKLVFRVRVRVPADLVAKRIQHVKTGLRGVAYVRLSPSVAWPESLDRRIPPDLFE